MKLCDDALSVLLENIVGDAFHAEDFHAEVRSIRQGVVDGGKSLFMYLRQVDGETPCRVQATITMAFEMLGFLVVHKDFVIVKVAFAVVTPWSGKHFLKIRVAALFLRHLAYTLLTE